MADTSSSVGKRVPPARVQQGPNAPMTPTRGTTSPQELDKRTTAVKPMRSPRSFTGGRRY